MPRKPRRVIKTRIIEGISEAALSFFWWDGTADLHGWAVNKTEAEIVAFWQKHKRAILDFYIERNRQRNGDPGQRPHWFWDELRRKRRKTGKDKWIGPVRADGGDRTIIEDRYETDYQFLKRLDLLEGWEKECEPKKR
jgi:hypothetical protein